MVKIEENIWKDLVESLVYYRYLINDSFFIIKKRLYLRFDYFYIYFWVLGSFEEEVIVKIYCKIIDIDIFCDWVE